MQKAIFFGACLIGLFLVVVYYKGASNVLGTGGGILDKTILYLQGRGSNGNITNYPS